MLRSLLLCFGFVLIFTALFTNVALSPTAPVIPVVIAPTAQVAQASEIPALPVRVIIPAIGLNASIADMGIAADGTLDVPSPRSTQVGWYQDGTVPGDTGSAVFDAHVVAAFKNLHKVKAGEDVYVTTTASTTLHFKIESTQTYKLSDLSPQLLFSQNDAKRLNLITCAGVNLGGGNYSERFVVFAVLVDDQK